jgi:hypothetical protein
MLKADLRQNKPFISAQKILDYHMIKEKKNACISYTWGGTFCSNFTLEYPYTKSIQHKAIAQIVKNRIKELSKEYISQIAGVEGVIDELNPDEGDTGHFDWDKSLRIFNFTSKSVTLSYTQKRYTGGAHGTYDYYYENYDLKTKKEISFQDLVKDEDKFIKIAEKIYRKTYDIPPNEDMTYDGWFYKDFRLASSFALVPQGFYFLYNSYEIQPYACGLTPLLIPYKAVKETLNPTFFTQEFFEQTATLSSMYSKTFANNLSVSIAPEGKKYLRITFKTKNTIYDVCKGWLCITFQGRKDIMVTHIKSNFERVKRYANGLPIYHKPTAKTIKKHSVLLEAYESKWNYNRNKNQHTLSFRIPKPNKGKKLVMLVHLIQKDETSTYLSPDPEYYKDGVVGQQGYTNYKIELNF